MVFALNAIDKEGYVIVVYVAKYCRRCCRFIRHEQYVKNVSQNQEMQPRRCYQANITPMAKPLTKGSFLILAEARGFLWLGEEVVGNHVKTTWKCSQGHKWEATRGNISQGKGCPCCSGNIPLTIDKFHDIAKRRNFKWLGDKITKAATKSTWECSQGHRWRAAYYSIKQGYGCPYCAGQARLTEERFRDLAKERGFKWLGSEVVRSGIKTTWECSQGHQWRADFDKIKQGKGCPTCAHKISKPEIQLREAIKAVYPDTVGNVRKLLQNRRLELDIYVPSLRKAIEYDGWAHTFFKDQQQRDERKNQECQEADIKLLRVKHKEYKQDTKGVTAKVLAWLKSGP